MNAAEALAHLTEISAQIQAAVVFDDEGTVVASTLEDDDRSQQIARGAAELLAAAELEDEPEKRIVQLEAALGGGSVFVVRDAGHTIAATTGRQPTAGLVFFDLKSCLRDIAGGDTPSSTAGARTDAGA